ncbi:NYN domain-containing protein [Accumulibacter sp.]|uniref:NYN domain-containing protein n=1 Tax=Accumulibacter sp. TaxID=2053492 RepID=UPI0025D34FA1|nr:NYN domain-containing protein [Accumulibacter sp.]MCM8596891.1 NYN domain-containing protein [Accumulibacter sp.]MCM8624390.1 NYN domain-containing protein [Accumulibacter sp.]MDS4051039.1 NYN domain-containing protein [Accumulibacter sp.]
MRTWVYIDGFNLYYGIRNSGCKWLNIKALSEAAMPSGVVVEKLKYYTARVSGIADSDQPRRQQIYLNALRTVPEVEIFFGQFLAKAMWRPVLNLPVGDRGIQHGASQTVLPPGRYPIAADPSVTGNLVESLPVGKYGKGNKVRQPATDAIKALVHAMEEKGSDVNLASHLINDGWADRYDAAVVISNDTDLVEPIRIVVQELMKPVTVLCPSDFGASKPLAAVASHVRHIRAAHLHASVFPDTLPGTNIKKPASW